MDAYSLRCVFKLFSKLINWERKGNLNERTVLITRVSTSLDPRTIP